MSNIYYLRRKTSTENKNPNVSWAFKGKAMFSAHFYECNNNKDKFVKAQEASIKNCTI